MTSDDPRPDDVETDDSVSFTRSAATRTAEPPDDLEYEDDAPEDRRRIVIIAGVVFVVIALIGFALTQGGGSDDDTSSSTPTSEGAAPGGGGEGEVITVLGTPDPFDRADTTGGVDPIPNGVPWEFPNGTWDIRGMAVALVAPSETRNFMVVDVGISDVQAQVRLTKAIAGAGLTFRYQDQFHFWALEPSPETGTVNIIKVDNEAQGPPNSLGVFRKIDEVPVADGSTIGVIQTGNQIQVLLDGEVIDTFEDPYLAGTGGVGLTARGLSEAPTIGEARWDDFIAGGPSGEGIIGKNGEGLPSDEGDAPADPGAGEPAPEEPAPTDTTAGG